MKRKYLVALPALALIGYLVWDFLRVDACLDSGGASIGYLGCMHSVPDVDRLVIDKSERQLFAYHGNRLLQRFPVSLGPAPVGPKHIEGDNRTPEGNYPVIAHKFDSSFFRALRLGYPTPAQAKTARANGVDPGSDIMIHGLPNGLGWIGRLHRLSDWTRGCIAVTNGEMNWLYHAVLDGTPVEIKA